MPICGEPGLDACSLNGCHHIAGVEASVFDTEYDVQWMADGRSTGESQRMPRTELFRKKPVVAKLMLKTWLAEVASCETVQVCCRPFVTLHDRSPSTLPPLPTSPPPTSDRQVLFCNMTSSASLPYMTLKTQIES